MGFEVHKTSLERHFYEKIISGADSKHSPCLVNNINNIFVILDVIVNNWLKTNDRLEVDL